VTKIATAPDKRPALVFDSINEILTIINALENYRIENAIENWTSDHNISMLVTELQKVTKFFNKKQ